VDAVSEDYSPEVSVCTAKVMEAAKEKETVRITCSGVLLEQVDMF